ncbi:hypothetical protein AVEN_65259-1 [Araneus ventricosus]|uniref:Histone-lysine N-methyltransferase SETMAR n=1 Tax=Araneus ventricosus TaxID=182803 RepID=A0A4Y2AFW6_ARAVE|nr:hypothetical protein AVEN_65259-1 [Araneus ventricosus]
MVVVGSKIRTLSVNVKHLPAPLELLQQLCEQQGMRASVVVKQHNVTSHAFCSEYHLFQHLKRFLIRQHFPSDDDIQMTVTRWLCSQAADFFDSGIQKFFSRYDTCFNSVGS